MILVMDTCNIGVGSEPSGGITLRFEGIEGLPNSVILVPVAKDAAGQLCDAINKMLNKPTIEQATLADLKKMGDMG